MLNTFPTLLSFNLLAPFILRMGLGLILLFLGVGTISIYKKDFINKFKNQNYPVPTFFVFMLGILEIIFGITLTIGIYTQISAIVVIYLILNILIIERKGKIFKQTNLFYLVLSLIALSLIFSGAGFLAIDLPL